MRWNQVKGDWATVQEGVKRTWGRIDETDLKMIHGERDLFIRVLAQRYGYAEPVAEKKVDAFIERLQPGSKRRLSQLWFSRLLKKCLGQIHVTNRR
ncbi:hypothetical protein Pla22_24760 [Rubripirellula amarantea]|uniref:CsbD-like domain-containing protein n=1 Tax=Rubripirellula amarantea TaxID=2527999 RepID=A0A5C5WY50_9BACT|nr:hypothetical protein Pla22_24760 [Rubripirellula amarantea]